MRSQSHKKVVFVNGCVDVLSCVCVCICGNGGVLPSKQMVQK